MTVSSHVSETPLAPLSIGWHDLATATGGQLQPPQAWGRCERISTDSRDLQPGDLFWALPGEQFDGHDFATAAVTAGASLVVCQADRAASIPGPKLVVDDALAALGRLANWHRRRHDALVIGVTGSVGKTTTKELIYAALSQQFRGLKSPGNFNNLIGLPKTLLQLTLDHEFAVCEFGAAREGDIHALAQIAAPEIGVVTAIGSSHLASFGSVEAIVRGKGELLAALPETGLAVLPGDDPVTRSMAERAGCRVLFVGQTPGQNDYVAEELDVTADEVSFTVLGERFTVALPGPALLTNALCAIAVAHDIGVPLDLIADGLDEFRPLAGRGAVRQIGSWTVIDDCYNASPQSVTAALQRLDSRRRSLPKSQRRCIAVLGDMRELGPLATQEHQRIGGLAAQLGIDGLIAYGEHAHDIAAGAIQAGMKSDKIAATDNFDLLRLILDCWLNDGDTLLIKGSRVMALERLFDWLEQAAQSSAAPALRRCA